MAQKNSVTSEPKVIWCDGRLIDVDAFRVSSADRGLLHGHGLFETMLCLDGRVVFASRHLDRWARSCERLGWPDRAPDLQRVAASLLTANRLLTGPARLRMSLTAGSGPLDDAAPGRDAVLWMSASPAEPPPESCTLVLSPWSKNSRSPLAGIKSSCYAENLLALAQARARGFDQALLLDGDGRLSEAATSNLFFIRSGRLFTPSLATGCLPGVTRGWVIETASSIGMPCDEGAFPLADLESADGAFLTSSIRGVVPVVRFGTRELPVTPEIIVLRDSWNAAIREPALSG
jgi:branched-subunit amino acid aminotransferase/4-amino-4-deoxychorismate lyase